jgi:hypothetical protein
LSGRIAFQADCLEAAFYRIMNEDPVSLQKLVPDLAPESAIAIDRALSKQLEQRFASVEEFLSALLGKEPAPHLPVNALPSKDKNKKKSLRYFSARIGVFLVLAVLLVGTIQLIHTNAPFAIGSGSDPASPAMVDKPEPVFDVDEFRFLAPGSGPGVADRNDGKSTIRPKPENHLTDQSIHEEIAPSVAQKLEQAHSLFSRKQFEQALQLARHSLIEQETRKAYELIALCYCGLRDLGNARASLQKLDRKQKFSIVKRCRGLGLDITP